MFRASSIVAMRKNDGHSSRALPLFVRSAQERVKVHLGLVEKVSKLRFPNHEVLGRVNRNSILKGNNGQLRQVRIHSLNLAQLGQRNDALEK